MSQNVSYTDTTITVSLTPDAEGKLQTGTAGFPDRYGILKIDDEIITYTNKTDSTFEGCVRGFSGVTSYSKLNNPEELVFSSSDAAPHTVTKNTGGLINGPVVHNLSKLFFIQFLNKLKKQFVPGFDERPPLCLELKGMSIGQDLVTSFTTPDFVKGKCLQK